MELVTSFYIKCDLIPDDDDYSSAINLTTELAFNKLRQMYLLFSK